MKSEKILNTTSSKTVVGTLDRCKANDGIYIDYSTYIISNIKENYKECVSELSRELKKEVKKYPNISKNIIFVSDTTNVISTKKRTKFSVKITVKPLTNKINFDDVFQELSPCVIKCFNSFTDIINSYGFSCFKTQK